MLGFCEECRGDVSCRIEEKNTIKIVKGKNVSYLKETAICNQCNSKLFISEIRDDNLKKLDEAFRKSQSDSR